MQRVIGLTERQQELLEQLQKDGFIQHETRFYKAQINKPLWTLVQLGHAHFGWGPKDSFLQCQGFLPGPDPDKEPENESL